MRINVYSEELTESTELVVKDVPQGDGEPPTRFYGVRLFLKSPQAILDHSTPEDNDETAITFWVREHELTILSAAMENLYRIARDELEESWVRNRRGVRA